MIRSRSPVGNGLRRKAVLAVLALRRGKIVSTDHLVGVVWGDDVHTGLGRAYHAPADAALAREHLTRALDLHIDLGLP